MAADATSKRSVYVETTIVSYMIARSSRDILILGRQEMTRDWWERHRSEYRLFISPQVIEEAQQGDPGAAEKRLRLLADMEALAPASELGPLAEAVRGELDISSKAALDAFHLAYAVFYELDYLLTWNCAHLANAENLRRLSTFCRREDLWLPMICTPQEMIEGPEVQ